MQAGRVLITGAGSGLGRALALRYASAGWRVGIADIVPERAELVAGEVRTRGATAEAFAVDVGSDASMERLRDEALQRLGGVDHLVNNAGVSSAGSVMDTSLDDWRWMLDINLMSVVRGCRAFLPSMVAQQRGHIVNTASFAGIACAAGMAAYSTAKAGVIALSETLRADMAVADTGVKVSVVCPSFFRTNLLENWRGPERARTMAAKLMDRAKENADDIAEAIFAGVMAERFMIVPTATERTRWRLKRFLPEFYFKKLVQALREAGRTL